MEVSATLLLELGVILAVLTVLGTIARRFALSPIPLYLVAGLALGEGGLAPVPAAGEFVETGASIGVVLLLLTLGLEFSIGEFATSLRRHLPSAWVDLVLNAAPGAIAGWLIGLNGVGILALAGVTWISSSGVIARLLSDLRRLGNRETPAVLSILVLEDFAMAAYLPLLAVLAAGGTFLQALFGMAIAISALVMAFVVSYRWGHHVGRLVAHPDNEQLLLRVLALTLIVAALAEFIHASAAVGAFLVGLTLTGEAAERARTVLSPLRDLFAAIFFLAIGVSVDPVTLLPMLPVALALAVVTSGTKVLTGQFAARRDGVARPGQLRAGTALIARGEFSLVIIGLVGSTVEALEAVATPYVFILAIVGPVLARFTGGRAPARRRPG
ncbi:cation:proton antiporter [Mycolicibacterium baixiangningiae]|uniref:cation:proton antiporter n=1 Tax=Mycolicibacterium baixiangningiae TaxID=2761578 RepID=UPI0018D0FB0F|nr:cation:proton antiporter [Mycolicibacterium baixiangningiae]